MIAVGLDPPGLAMTIAVSFYKVDDGRLCAWRATLPRRKPFLGSTMASGRDLPHDLAQFVVESALGLRHGFWSLLASGATFESVPGRRRTKPGQRLVADYKDALNVVEGIVNAHLAAWRAGEPTPVGEALDRMYARWQALAPGEELHVEWTTDRLPGTGRDRRRAGSRRVAPRNG
jgi:hypothetical protein